jgi:hypothetical protein
MGVPGSKPGEGMIIQKEWYRANKKTQKFVICYSLLVIGFKEEPATNNHVSRPTSNNLPSRYPLFVVRCRLSRHKQPVTNNHPPSGHPDGEISSTPPALTD